MNRSLLRVRYILFDIFSAIIVWILFMAFRRIVNDAKLYSGIPIFTPNFNFYTVLFTFPILCVSIHYLSGYYLNTIKQSKINEFFTTLVSSALISIIIFFVLLLDDVVIDYTFYYKSLIVLFLLLFSITYFFRTIQSANIRSYFKKGKWKINTLIVGTGKNAKKIAAEVTKSSYFNQVVGFIKVENYEREVDGSEIVGNIFNMEKVIADLNVKEAIIALDDASEKRIFDIINKLFQSNIDIQFTPRLYEILTGRVRIDKYGLNPLVSISQSTMSDWQICLKRAADIFVSLISLALLSPLIIYIVLAVKLDSKGSAIFKQERIGKQGKPFQMYKFRTMYDNAEIGQPKLSSPDDSRITKVGRFLRKYRFDEIPQFFNVIKGEMSLVGPRPERKFYIDQIIREAPYYCLLYRIQPGLTSWGPIKIGYADTIEKMIERLNYDIVYIENMSISVDLKIILSTLEIIFKGKGV